MYMLYNLKKITFKWLKKTEIDYANSYHFFYSNSIVILWQAFYPWQDSLPAGKKKTPLNDVGVLGLGQQM